MRTALATAARVGLMACGAAAVTFAFAATGEFGSAVPPAQNLRVGAVCKADFSFATEVSCGLVSFGDVRFQCPQGTHIASCPRTRSVTLKNTGRTSLQVITISGSGPGERVETVSGRVRPGASATVGPRAGDTYLYDIVLRSSGGLTQARVTTVS
ncbi:hypothetical protein [Streptomyces sp. NBC_01637]|uniref:hypothetical protein n=1 Tax=unclassified Streptomyces TaxID=2593676 RepID=UPI00386F0E3C|nr:hypothetical protein OH719_00665 [Streptomyces sp. NBC_01653]WTC84546.1 hypothetical protein OH719_46205 [Streptomyces sp. NBC_01653]WTD86321.1 hypothetical protein OG891_00665 [Streptomyces sp. NBC_01637]WTD94203.1 hypothetical protein OG891_46200 [Streptomyces sp. NBC_01637]